jgi:hypothetical protein
VAQKWNQDGNTHNQQHLGPKRGNGDGATCVLEKKIPKGISLAACVENIFARHIGPKSQHVPSADIYFFAFVNFNCCIE